MDPAHPFLFVSGLSLNLAITVKSPTDGGEHFARIKVPDNVDRFVELTKADEEASSIRFLPMEELIAAFLPVLFPGMEIVEHHAFRITRNADMSRRKTGTRTYCRRWSASLPAAGSAPRSVSRSPTT